MLFIYQEMRKWESIIRNIQPESHLLISLPAWPDSPQIIHRYGDTQDPIDFKWFKHSSTIFLTVFPSIHCVSRLLLGKICKAEEFDPSQNKLRRTVVAALSRRATQQLGEAMLCWLNLSAHLAYLHNGPSFPWAEEKPQTCACGFRGCGLCFAVYRVHQIAADKSASTHFVDALHRGTICKH